jgi:hypothetical protein
LEGDFVLRTICKWTTILMALVIVAGIAALIYAFASDSHYDPNAVVQDTNGFTSRGAYVTNSAWAWTGGIMLGIAVPVFVIALIGWICAAVASGGRKMLRNAGVGGIDDLLGSVGAVSGAKTTPGWASTGGRRPPVSSPPSSAPVTSPPPTSGSPI